MTTIELNDEELQFVAAACRTRLGSPPGQRGSIDNDEQRAYFEAAKTLLTKIQPRRTQ